ncbi:MAG: alpha-galactosidase [Clostridia bacterium]|nr:alpha-galactosidase [Clostridia bacterium]MBQ6102292.1 alpha-galactosidase [Kiritimatiellia bacterium]
MQTDTETSIETVLGPASLAGIASGGVWRASLASVRPEEGVEEIVLSLETEDGAPHAPPRVALSLHAQIGASVSCWTPQHVHFEMPLPWTQARVGANAARDLPLYANVGPDGAARLVLAVSECVRRVSIRGVVDEFRSDEELEVAFFTEPEDALTRYSARIRLDVRVRPFALALAEAANWLDESAAAQLATLCPHHGNRFIQHSAFGIQHSAAKRPWYSTWYSYHQNVSAEAVVAEARAARKLGMRGLLLDAGWMKSRPGIPGGWMAEARFGDWTPDPKKFPDMRDVSRAVRAEGLAFGLWFALPFVSRHASAWRKWHDKMLWIRHGGTSEWGILDPRFPEVRAHLASLFGRVTREWELDGLKLDFIDSFELRTSAPANAPGALIAPNLPQEEAMRSDGRTAEPEGGRNFVSVPRAVVALMADVSAAIRAVKPDALVEFRQGYVGPAIRPFGNMMRASDCPSCIATNRIKTVDLRLTSGATPVHGDMLEWDLGASAEDAALQLLATLFAVPQISVRLADLPPRHRAMLRFWLRFWNAHRATLLDAPFRPLHPEAAYPVVAAAGAEETVTAVYQSGAVADAFQDGAATGYVVNATAAPGLAVRLPSPPRSLELYDCTGRKVPHALSVGRRASILDVPVPPSGLAVFRA